MHASSPEHVAARRTGTRPALISFLLAIALAVPLPAQEPPAETGGPDAPADTRASTDPAGTDTGPAADGDAQAADDAPVAGEGEVVLDTVVVTGEQPGPGLWTVSRDGRVMRVLGYVGPLPRRMYWNSAEVEARIAESGVVLMPPIVQLRPRGGAITGLFLLPSLLSARNNPDKDRLQDVLPPEDYARWQPLKQRYFGRDRGIEKRRPLVAAMELREKAFEAHDLTGADLVLRMVRRAARKAGVPLRQPAHAITIEEPRAALREFRRTGLDDVECFRRSLAQVENDLPTLATRANAWALGRLDVLAKLDYTDAAGACMEAVLQSRLAEKQGLAEAPARVRALWLEAAEQALGEHDASFAVLPMSLLLGKDSLLSELERRGYSVQPPE
ncbi:TraB/GumN family protein [Arenimonas fontis]|uniref:TraB/GumN family protein n=1 Tax=Arenimonas fontis TaxID=2608255 RepID=A0A5B2Z5K0_9GAMM|nr:TraB/GumN family protein [Arenimonas fontis]KAA2284118.1 TraB/GumN family protein [Arenimonas fontis]